MWCWVAIAWAGPADDGGELPLATPEVPDERLYGKVETDDGPARARLRRRRDGEFAVWELPTGTIIRYQKLERSVVAEDHVLDAAGYPWVTILHSGGKPQQAVVHGVPRTEHDLTDWNPQQVPGGTLLLPTTPEARSGGGVRGTVLGGEVDIWMDTGSVPGAPSVNPFEDTFRDGLVAGCGCFVVDRATTWIDGRPGVRYRLLVPGRWPRDAVDLWAVPVQGGLWLMSFRVQGPEDPVAALLPGRILAATARITGKP